jgi:hypothetical protein
MLVLHISHRWDDPGAIYHEPLSIPDHIRDWQRYPAAYHTHDAHADLVLHAQHNNVHS